MMFKNKKEQLKRQQEQLKRQQEQIEEYNKNLANYHSFKKLLLPFQLKQTYNSIIPLHLYTCWHTKDLPPLMSENYHYLVESNPKITFHLYDEEDCRQFIKDHFEEEVLHAYNSLVPCSYKSDLWRYCVLYINGGIYMDIKYRCVNNFKFIALTEKEHFVRDYNIKNTYTALIVTLPKNEIMRKCIYKIVENVKNENYGDDDLEPTGPTLLGKNFTQEEKDSMELYHSLNEKLKQYYIVYYDRIILSFFKGYREEQSVYQKIKRYSELWDERNIYKKE